MSRKSRRRNTPELVREPAIDESVDERLSVHHLTGELHETLEAIISGCAFLAKGPVPAELLDPDSEEFEALAAELADTLDDDSDTADPDVEEIGTLESEEAALDAEIDQLRDMFGGVALTTRVLARALIARTLDRGPRTVEQYYVPTASEAETETAMLDGLAHALLPPNVPPALRPSRTEQKAAFEDAVLLIREVGLEEFDVSCDVDVVGDGSYELLAFQVSPESAHVELMEFLFDRAEAVAEQEDPLLVTERNASSWEFMRWSVAPPPGRSPSDGGTFARHVREQEYSLVDRSTVALGMSVIGELADDEGFAEMFPRQHRMAAALTTSVVGVFECVALDGTRATFNSIRDGSTYVVHEHLEPIEYATGWVAAGRLLPFDGTLYLRSPGMVFTRGGDLNLVRAAANEMAELERTLPPALAVEAFISAAMLGVNVPRVVKPVRSKADASTVLAALQLMLADSQLESDATLDAFAAALAEQAGAGAGGDKRALKSTKRTTRGKSKRRR